ncbi:MAG: SRPBCC family protein [Streptosporangiales bacterium]|nr:SRPBCC family protein [Streptosporangiales bacterium]MBO0891592.1 SRPBCC family protein [Acidothermales bacterium]
MARAYASGVVPASADEVWAVVRDFDGLPSWHPAIAGSEIEQGTNLVVGAVRRLALDGGGAVGERLMTLDDVDRSYTYEFTDPGPFPVRTYRSTIRVAPVTDTGHAFVEWYAWFDAEAADEAGLVEQYADGVYGSGIAALQARFGG